MGTGIGHFFALGKWDCTTGTGILLMGLGISKPHWEWEKRIHCKTACYYKPYAFFNMQWFAETV